MVHEWYQCYCLVSSVKVIVTEHVLRMQTKFYRACSTQSMKRYLRKRREWIRNIFWSGVSNTLLCLKPYVRISVVRWFLMLQSLRVWLCCGGNVGQAAGLQGPRSSVGWPGLRCFACPALVPLYRVVSDGEAVLGALLHALLRVLGAGWQGCGWLFSFQAAPWPWPWKCKWGAAG